MSNAAVFARIGGLASDLQRSQRDLTNEAALAVAHQVGAGVAVGGGQQQIELVPAGELQQAVLCLLRGRLALLSPALPLPAQGAGAGARKTRNGGFLT